MTVSTNFWDNGKEGNYWGNYNGSDMNGDGICDTPYVIDASNQDNYPLMAPVDIDSVSIELPEWESPSSNPSPEPQTSQPKDQEPFPTVPVAAASVAAVVVVGAGLLVYFKKRKR